MVHKDRPEYLNICSHTIAVTSENYNYDIIIVKTKENNGEE